MMRRGSTWYVKRYFAGIGPVKKSLGTPNKTRARQLEDMLLALHGQGRLDLVRAWLAGDVEVERLADAYQGGKLHELAATLVQKDVPLKDAIQSCLRAKAPHVAPGTHQRYAEGLDHFRDFCDGRKLASVREALTTEISTEFTGARLEAGAAKETVNNDLIAVSVLATHCVKQGWLSARPEIRKFKSQVRIRWLEPDQLRLYMASIRAPFRPLMQLLVGTGLRLGEAEGLRVCDLRFGDREARALVEDAKTPNGVRPVFVPQWVAEVLRQLVEEQALSGADPIFTIPRGTVQKEHRRACKIAGLVDYTIHDHRHTAAVHLVRAGMPIPLLQQQLGHATIEMTMRYARFHPEYGDVRGYFDRVAQTFGVSGTSPGTTPTDEETAGEESDWRN